MFSPTEKVNHHRLKTLLFHQIVADVFSSGSPKLTESEQSEMITYLTANGVRNFTETSYVSDDVRDWVIACAKSWKLYFSRIYPVVVIRDRDDSFPFRRILKSSRNLVFVGNKMELGGAVYFREINEKLGEICVLHFGREPKETEIKLKIPKT